MVAAFQNYYIPLTAIWLWKDEKLEGDFIWYSLVLFDDLEALKQGSD